MLVSRAIRSALHGWPIAIVLPGMALLLDRLLFMEGGVVWPFRGFAYVGFGLAAAAYVFVQHERAPSWPRLLELSAGVLYVAAGVMMAVGLAVLLPAAFGVAVGVLAIVEAAVSGSTSMLYLAVLTPLGLLGLSPIWAAMAYAQAAKRARLRVAENLAAAPSIAIAVFGATLATVISVAIQSAWFADPPIRQVDELPPMIAGLGWSPSGARIEQPADATIIAARCGPGQLHAQSPDGKWVAFERSPHPMIPNPLPPPGELFGGVGRHHVYICNLATGSRRHIIALTERDTGSGGSFDPFLWSTDSSALRLKGGGRVPGVPGNASFDAIYVLRDRKWYVTTDAPDG